MLDDSNIFESNIFLVFKNSRIPSVYPDFSTFYSVSIFLTVSASSTWIGFIYYDLAMTEPPLQALAGYKSNYPTLGK